MLAYSAADCGFQPQTGQTTDYKICMYLLLRFIKENEERLFGMESCLLSAASCLPTGCCFNDLAL
jgi:hypothetical protein